MIIRHASDLSEQDVTPESVYLDRRKFIKASIAAAAVISIPNTLFAAPTAPKAPDWLQQKLSLPFDTTWPAEAALTPLSSVTSYNNFYEFGFDKADPGKNAGNFVTDPWTLSIEGEVENPGVVHLEDFIKPHALEERIYRLRCVEGWSMVIPWLGIPLAALLAQYKPTSKAKYVQFVTLEDSKQFPEQGGLFNRFPWPYIEGLRLDEAMHPLTFMAVGLYGKALPNQNGAPLRLVVPWKYGFKSIKSIVAIKFVDEQPETTWNNIAANEYGFYANVNPGVDHPRWSQKTERRLPSGLFGANRIPTQMFNGYGDQVAQLYAGMDLTRFY